MWADYPVSHVDLGARHVWLVAQREALSANLQDPDWPGDPKVAGWWLWGQCAWIGSGWCDWWRDKTIADSLGQIPHVSNAGRGELMTSGGRAAWKWLHKVADRLERVRVIHGNWDRCLNHHYGGKNTAAFFDPPYEGFEECYGKTGSIAQSVADWARDHEHLRIAIAGHVGNYDLPGWDAMRWERCSNTYSGTKTKSAECVWFSPACLSGVQKVLDL